MDAIEAIRDCLVKLDAKPGDPISIFDIGVPLIESGHDQDAVLNGLFYLESQKAIELLPGNRLALRKPLIQPNRK